MSATGVDAGAGVLAQTSVHHSEALLYSFSYQSNNVFNLAFITLSDRLNHLILQSSPLIAAPRISLAVLCSNLSSSFDSAPKVAPFDLASISVCSVLLSNIFVSNDTVSDVLNPSKLFIHLL